MTRFYTLNKFRHAGNCGSRSKPVTKICAFKTAQACLKHTFKHSGVKPFERQTHNTTFQRTSSPCNEFVMYVSYDSKKDLEEFTCRTLSLLVPILCDVQCQEQYLTPRARANAEIQRLQKLSLEQQRNGVAPLPVVRVCFVGRGRAGKTTTLRRLKGEPFRDEEPSTHGLDVWACRAEADLKADDNQRQPWKNWEESMHLTALKDACSFGLFLEY